MHPRLVRLISPNIMNTGLAGVRPVPGSPVRAIPDPTGNSAQGHSGRRWYHRYMSSMDGMTADLDADGIVGVNDLLILLGSWS